MVVGTLGIALCGACRAIQGTRAASKREAGPGEFSLVKGLLLSLLAGVLSAVYGIGLNDVAAADHESRGRLRRGAMEDQHRLPVRQSRRFSHGARLLPLSCPKEPLAGRVDSGSAQGPERASLAANYLLAILVGALWYGQFFVYSPGRVRLGPDYEFSSWAILMIMIVLFSTVLALGVSRMEGLPASHACRHQRCPLVLVAAVCSPTATTWATSKPSPGRYPAAESEPITRKENIR